MASDSTLPELIAKANALANRRIDVVRMVNDLFATIAEVAEEEREGKYGALTALAARMQDERDEAREELQAARAELDEVKSSRDELLTRVGVLQRQIAGDGLAAVGALTIRGAAVKMRNSLDRIRKGAMTSSEDARMAARAQELVVVFDEETKDYIAQEMLT